MKISFKVLFGVTLSFIFSSCLLDSDEDWSATSVCPVSKRGTFTDERDGQVYKYTTIGKQVWMAENLNFKENGSECFVDGDDCSGQNGRFYYLWQASCPIGWHVPSKEEWKSLFKTMGGQGVAGLRLKSLSGWPSLNPEDDGNGTDDCGFNIEHMITKNRKDEYRARYLSSANYDPNNIVYDKTWIAEFKSYQNNAELNDGFIKGESTNIRCIRD